MSDTKSAPFSKDGAGYRDGRPTYGDDLFSWIGSVASGREACWDCGTGSGQAAQGLAKVFDHVVATDIHFEQLKYATSASNIEYRIAAAEEDLGFRAHFDAIIAACAIHWFDRDAFYRTADLALKPGGVLCAWTYEMPWTGGAQLDAALRYWKDDVLAGFWSPEAPLYLGQYRDITIPFERIDVPPFYVELENSPDGLLRFLSTWSPVTKYREATGRDPLETIADTIRAAWPTEMGGKETYRLPLHFVCGRKIKI